MRKYVAVGKTLLFMVEDQRPLFAPKSSIFEAVNPQTSRTFLSARIKPSKVSPETRYDARNKTAMMTNDHFFIISQAMSGCSLALEFVVLQVVF